MNKALIIGRLGDDPYFNKTQGGQSVCNFSVATNEQWTDKDDRRQERTTWHRVVAWGKLAEQCDEYLSKGRMVYVEGRMQHREYENNDGDLVKTFEIVAHTVKFLDKPEDDGGGRGRSNGRSRDRDNDRGSRRGGGGGGRSRDRGRSSRSRDRGRDRDRDDRYDGDDIPF